MRIGSAGPSDIGTLVSLRHIISRGVLTLGSGQVGGQGLSLLRNIVVARVLSPDDVGIGATFAVALSLLEMVSYLAADQLLIQAHDGDDEGFQGTAHLLQIVRSLLSALLLLAFAWPIASLFGLRDETWAFQLLAVVPLIRGLSHFDSFRLQRRMSFGPQAKIELASQAAAAALAWPLCSVTRDYTAVLWLVIIQVLARTVATHLVATRRYRLTWNATYARRFMHFGWPLLVNNLLMLIIFQGDRIVVGAAYTLSDLGVYSLAFGLVMMPTVITTHVMSTVALPVLSRIQERPAEFERRYRQLAEVVALVACLVAIPLILEGGVIMRLLYGAEYRAAGAFIGWIAIMQAIRLMRVIPTTAALARGDTLNSLVANLGRAPAIGLAVLAAAEGMPLAWVAATGAVGEAAALLVCSWRLGTKHRLLVSISLVPAGIGLCTLLSTALASGFTDRGPIVKLLICVAIMGVAALAMTVSLSALRGQVTTLLFAARARLAGVRHAEQRL